MPNAWVEHVRKFASKNNMSYGCAVSDAECKASYHRQKARNAKKTRTPAQEMEGMGAEDMPVAEVAKRRRARVSKARQAQVAEADPPKKQKDFTYKTREEKLEYARLQDLAEKAAEKSKPKNRVTAAKKVIDNFDLLKMISGFVRKPIVYDEDEDLQAIAYATKALDTIDLIASDADIKVSKAFISHLRDRMGLVSWSRYEKYKHMTDDELQAMYDAEQEFELYPSTLESIADDYGMDIKLSGDYKLTRARINKSRPKAILPWLYNFITEQRKEEEKKDKKSKK
jgi:hypothetical protein